MYTRICFVAVWTTIMSPNICADLVFSISEAVPGKSTNWSISGSGTTLFRHYSELIGPYAGDRPWITTPRWQAGTIGGRESNFEVWHPKNNTSDSIHDLLFFQFAPTGTIPPGTDLSTATGTVVFDIPMSSISNLPISGPGYPRDVTGSGYNWTFVIVPEPSAFVHSCIRAADEKIAAFACLPWCFWRRDVGPLLTRPVGT